MARAALPGGLKDEPTSAPSGGWCTAVVREVRHPNPDAVLLRLEVASRTDHLPGQHYVFRLTAEDGFHPSTRGHRVVARAFARALPG